MTILSKYFKDIAIVISVLLFGAVIYLGIQNYKLRKSVSTFEKEFERQREDNINKFDSIGIIIKNKEQDILEGKKDVEELKEQISKINYDETPVDNMHDPDSIFKLFARYYPN